MAAEKSGSTENGVFDQDHYKLIVEASEMLQMMIASSHFVKIVGVLRDKQCLSEEIASKIIQSIAKEKADPNVLTTAWSLFLHQLPRCHEEWYWEFMALFSDTVENQTIRDFISPKYQDEFNSRNAAIQLAAAAASKSSAVGTNGSPDYSGDHHAAGTSNFDIQKQILDEMTFLGVDESFEDWLNGNPITTTRTLPLNAYDDDESDSDDDVPQENLRLRSYQHELCAHALAGKNTIIVAPTGSGKTFVAAQIVLRHLDNNTDRVKPKKVAFIVPTNNLIRQQADVLKRFLRRSYKVKELRGGQVGVRQLPKALDVRRNDVLIMTPQILLNIMMDPSPNVDPVPLDLFTLLIFDECHHAELQHPYSEIMKAYLGMKLDAKYAIPAKVLNLPQVIGLTASLGVGDADNSERARWHVLNVCANMDTEVLSTVVMHAADLAEHVSVPVDDLVRVSANYTTHPFAVHVTSLIVKIETQYVSQMFEKLVKPEANLPQPRYTSSIDPPIKKYSADYRSWVCAWLHELPTCYDVSVKATLMTALAHLNVYHNALFLNGHVQTRQAIAYLTQEVKLLEQRQASEVDRELIKWYKKELIPHISIGTMLTEKNAMVEKMKEILLDEFEQRPDSRALVFVCTRELTIALSNYMNEDTDLQFLRASRLVGIQASRAQGGQTVNEQLDLLEKFRSGYHRVMIVTSVAEEGLDVEKCNLIIKYNHVSDEISMVQRRGRGRATGSRSILLTQDGCVEDKEMLNLIREKMMVSAIEHISRMGSDWFRDEVQYRQREAYEDRRRKVILIEQKRLEFGGKIYHLLCKNCDTLIIMSTDIRRVAHSHFVGVDPAIWDRVEAIPDEKPRIFESNIQAGRISCLNCREECGNVIKYTNVYLPALKADAFVQEFRDGMRMRHHVRKWKKMTDELFVIDAITLQDLRVMYAALKKESVLKELEERIVFAVRLHEQQLRQQQFEKERS